MEKSRPSQRLEFAAKFALWLAAAAIILLATTLRAQTPSPLHIMLGTAWYPEQWPESRWDADLPLMQQAGIHMVRVGEGQYDLDWLDRAVTAASKHGLYSVIGTPTAAPPAWLTQKYPETLLVDEEGHRRNMETGRSSTLPMQNIANWRAKSPNSWPCASVTILGSWVGKSTMSIPTSRSIPPPLSCLRSLRHQTDRRNGRSKFVSENARWSRRRFSENAFVVLAMRWPIRHFSPTSIGHS